MIRYLALWFFTFIVFSMGFCAGVLSAQVPPLPDQFLRGDANGDDVVDGADAVFIRNYYFLNGDQPACMDTADADDDGDIDFNDIVYILEWRFSGGPPPPDPGPIDCGDDPTADVLDCDSHVCND